MYTFNNDVECVPISLSVSPHTFVQSRNMGMVEETVRGMIIFFCEGSVHSKLLLFRVPHKLTALALHQIQVHSEASSAIDG